MSSCTVPAAPVETSRRPSGVQARRRAPGVFAQTSADQRETLPVPLCGDQAPVNSMRFTFLDPQAQAFYPEWAPIARSAVAALRIAAAQNPDDQQLMNLIGELSMRSEPFRTRWAAQDVYVHRHGTKSMRHPAIGVLELTFEALALSGDDGLTILTYSAEPGTPSGDGLELLATWAATQATVPSRPSD